MINGWEDPNQSWMALRCTETKYAKDFVEKGQLKFNTPQSWVDWSVKNIGRGDPYEGIIAAVPTSNTIQLEKYKKRYYDLRIDQYDNYSLFRSEEDMNLPCFCYYCIKNGLFVCPKEEGHHRLPAHIPDTYFKDFDDLKPAVVMFGLFDFHKALFTYFNSIGVKENEILVQKINYSLDLTTPSSCLQINMPRPEELFFKTNRYKEQMEERIIINTKDPHILEILSEPIEIGKLQNALYFDRAELERNKGLDVYMEASIKKRYN